MWGWLQSEHEHLFTLIGILIGSLFAGGLIGLANVRGTKRKTQAEAHAEEASAEQVLTATALSLVEPLKRELREAQCTIQGLQKQVSEQDSAMTDYLREIAELRRRLAEAEQQMAAMEKTIEIQGARIAELEAEKSRAWAARQKAEGGA